MTSRLLTLASAFLVASVALAGCFAKTNEGGSSGGACTNIEPSSYDQTCKLDTDCEVINTGPFCAEYTCTCPGGGAINVADDARYSAALSAKLASEVSDGTPTCECPGGLSSPPKCLGGTCTICTGLASDPPGCHSTSLPDAGSGGACVDIDLTTYDQSCNGDSDCIIVTPGVLCPGACACGGAAVNFSEATRYGDAISSLSGIDRCPCAFDGTPTCVQNKCVLCGGPSPSAACPDGG
jgi:hypothetical protein